MEQSLLGKTLLTSAPTSLGFYCQYPTQVNVQVPQLTQATYKMTKISRDFTSKISSQKATYQMN